MFFVLGMIPGWICAKILNGMGILRIPRKVELAGLDVSEMIQAEEDAKTVREAEVAALN